MSDPGTAPAGDLDDTASEQDTIDDEQVGPYEADAREEALDTVTNDAVAGETVEPQPGDGTDDGPTGGAPREGEPDLDEHAGDDDGGTVDLGTDVATPL